MGPLQQIAGPSAQWDEGAEWRSSVVTSYLSTSSPRERPASLPGTERSYLSKYLTLNQEGSVYWESEPGSN